MIKAEGSIIHMDGCSIVKDTMMSHIKGDDRYTPFESCYNEIMDYGSKNPGFNFTNFIEYLEQDGKDFDPTKVNISSGDDEDDVDLSVEDEDDTDIVLTDKLSRNLDTFARDGSKYVLNYLKGKMRNYIVSDFCLSEHASLFNNIAQNLIDDEDGEEIRSIERVTYSIDGRDADRDIYINDLRIVCFLMAQLSVTYKWDILSFAVTAYKAASIAADNPLDINKADMWDCYVWGTRHDNTLGRIQRLPIPTTTRSKSGDFREFRDSFTSVFYELGKGFVNKHTSNAKDYILLARAFYTLCELLSLDIMEITTVELEPSIIASGINLVSLDDINDERSFFYGVRSNLKELIYAKDGMNRICEIVSSNCDKSAISFDSTLDSGVGDEYGFIKVDIQILSEIDRKLSSGIVYNEQLELYSGGISFNDYYMVDKTVRIPDEEIIREFVLQLAYYALDGANKSGEFDNPYTGDYFKVRGLNEGDLGFYCHIVYSQPIVYFTTTNGNKCYYMIHNTGVVVQYIEGGKDFFNWAEVSEVMQCIKDEGDFDDGLAAVQWFNSSCLLY